MKKEMKLMEFEKTFDNAAKDYENTRPCYPGEIYEYIFRYVPITERSNLLEIGIGTGKGTKPFLDKGCSLTAIEPGENLANYAVSKFKDYANFSLHMQTLQDFVCPADTFDLIYSATAFHWIPEEYGYPRVYELLKRGGAFARFAYHAGPDRIRTGMFNEIQAVYRRYVGGTEPKEHTEEDAGRIAAVADKYGFVDIDYKLYTVTKDFTADEYMGLLRTYPDHMRLEEEKRNKLFAGIHDAISGSGGVITIYYTMDLQLARKI